MEKSIVSVSFVCLGNICRSPLAQGVFEDLLEREGLLEKVMVSSAGVGNWHVGAEPDARMQKTAKARGIVMRSRAQQIVATDFRRLDLVLAMDRSNMDALMHTAPTDGEREKLKMFRSFDPEANGDLDVPDPYYGGDKGFDLVFNIVHRTCPKILQYLREHYRF
jgi:protein-tyrosine phosphatase